MSVEQHFNNDLPAYALGALDKEETLRIEEHLANCLACRSELQAFLQVTELLPLATNLHEPTAGLEQRILAQVMVQPVDQAMRPSHGLRERLADFWRILFPAWGIISLALIFLLVVSNLTLLRQINQPPASGDFLIVSLMGTERTTQASGILLVSRDGREGTLTVENLPPLQTNLQYQLWLIRDGKRTSGGVFSVNSSGYGHLEVASSDSLLSYDSFGVTIEPAGGSPGPTGNKVLGGKF